MLAHSPPERSNCWLHLEKIAFENADCRQQAPSTGACGGLASSNDRLLRAAESPQSETGVCWILATKAPRGPILGQGEVDPQMRASLVSFTSAP